jgi:hypothetical protein
MRKKPASGLAIYLLGVVIPLVGLVGGCDGTQTGSGTATPFSPEADKKRQDAMREGMMKLETGLPGKGKPKG